MEKNTIIPQNEKADLTPKKEGVLEYILGSMLFVPKFYIQNRERYVEIKVYEFEKKFPAMKIFRMLHECNPTSRTPEGTVEFAFQDEVNILTDAGMDHMTRWQVNFSLYLEKESLSYRSVGERPEALSEDFFKSVNEFSRVMKIAGSTVYAGDWKFVSDGTSWIRKTSHGAVVPYSEIKSLIPWNP